jgi:catechol 2,3-dioxygenase-like lactoylglutathione lyase family enzyme
MAGSSAQANSFHVHRHVARSRNERSVTFYRDVFGMEVGFRDGNILFLHSPNHRDDLAPAPGGDIRGEARVGKLGGFEHCGITVKNRDHLDICIALVQASGGTLVNKGEHAQGVPYAYVTDPDGYVIEI